MAKRITPVQSAKSGNKVFSLPELHSEGLLFIRNFWAQAAIVFAVAFGFYINSYSNKYALDDDIVMRQNMYVQKGFAGIPEILANDAYKSFYESMGVDQQLAGGRYRPLSIVTFAIEQQLFGERRGARFEEVRDSLLEMQRQGISDLASQSRLIAERDLMEKEIKEDNMLIALHRHVIQVLLFAFSLIIVLRFLRNHIFRNNTDIAFLSVLLFAIHPIHTEVVANVKSRDEIFSLLFIILTLESFFRYDLSRKRNDMLLGILYFVLAFLSKEYAIVLVALIPAGLMLFHKRSFSQLSSVAVPIAAVLMIYGAIRLGVKEDVPKKTPAQIAAEERAKEKSKDPLNEPYMFAKGPQETLSKINRLDDYVWLLFYPVPLAADYSYQHFPYSNANDPGVWISILVMGAMLYATYRLWKEKHPLAFAMIFFFGFFMLINNLIFDIGATMGERLIYHSSLGFCMALAWGIVYAAKYAQDSAKYAVTGVFVALMIPAGMITTERNLEWHDDETLFIADVQKHPNSALCNGNAGARYMDRGLKYLVGDSANQDSVNYYADIAIGYLQKSVDLHPKYANGWLNLGLCYYNKQDYAKASAAWHRVYLIFPSNPILQGYARMLLGRANEFAVKKDYENASKFYQYAVYAYPADSKIWADYAGSSFMARKYEVAMHAFDTAWQRTSDPAIKQNLSQGYKAAHYNDSVVKLYNSDSANPKYNFMVAQGIIGSADFYPEAKRLLNKVLTAVPQDQAARKLLDSIGTLEEKQKVPPPIK
jgi:tetratricopeptide (TPR) repeat protein